MSLASDRPEFTPPPAPGRLRAIGLAILAHVFLIAALTWGVSWKRESTSSPVQAELWSAIPQEAAPALVEAVAVAPPVPVPVPKLPQVAVQSPKTAEAPPEPVVDPQIAIEKAKKQKLEEKKALADAKAKTKAKADKEAEAEAERQAVLDKKKRLEAKKIEMKKAADELAKKTAADKKAREAQAAKEEAALKNIRDAQLKRVAGLAGASGGESATGTAKQSSGPSAGYGGKIIAAIRPKIAFDPESVAGNPVVFVEIRTASDGTILARRMTKSSGNKAWDDAVLRGIDKAEMLPRDLDGRVPPLLEMTFRPKD